MSLVSCLMITGKDPSRRRLAGIAVECLLEQTYEPCELVIVNTASEPWFADYSVYPAIHEHMADPSLSLGELRNFSYEIASGELLMQWDDDDFHAENRISWQVENHKPGFVSILRRQYRLDIVREVWGLVDATTWPRGGIVGTMLHEPTEFRYPAIAKAEDTRFIQQFYDQGLVNPQDNPAELYVRLYHGANTWHRQKVMRPALRHGRNKGDAELIARVQERYKCIS